MIENRIYQKISLRSRRVSKKKKIKLPGGGCGKSISSDDAPAGSNGSFLLGARSNNGSYDAPRTHQSKLPSIPTKDDPPAAASLDSDIERSLQEEITALVLLRLPAMELVRLKKLWHITLSPSFVSAHLKHFKSDPSSHYLLVRDSMMIYISDVLPLGPLDSIVCCTSPHMVIVGSVNGLICFAGVSRNYPTPDDIFIFNPVTRLSRKLPPSKYHITCDTRSVNLAFWWNDDSDSTTDCGGAYKVAKIVTIPNVQCMLELWDSSNPNIWTDITALYFNFNYWVTRSLPHPCDVLIEGDAAYWMVRNHEENLYVLSLDLNSLGVKFIALSQQQMITQSELYAWRGEGPISTHLFCASCNGNLVLLRNRFSGDRLYDIWTMARTAGGGDFCWFKWQWPIRLDFRFLDCVGSINGELILRGINDILAMYDLRTGRRTRLIEDSNLEYVRILSAHDFVGSLVWIKGFGPNQLPRVGVTWPYPYFGYSAWVTKGKFIKMLKKTSSDTKTFLFLQHGLQKENLEKC